MGRVLTFSRVILRDKALVMFWRRGFQATTVADLLESMGIGRGSFYAAFRDKRSLFVECLDLFAQRTQASVLQARAELPPIEALERFFDSQFVASERPASSHAACWSIRFLKWPVWTKICVPARADTLTRCRRFLSVVCWMRIAHLRSPGNSLRF
ncbi:MAG: TetR/AcrR family transcriptional regulator [Betaproteobacteria bacterium]|nr:TetR/AcrR family transcriptional regulator [Betaproteobacteria bacterium]